MNAGSAALCVVSLALGVALGAWLAPGSGLGPQGAQDLASALEEENLLLRSGQLAASLEGLAPDTLNDYLAVLHDRRVGVSDEELRVVMLAWARFDAPGAFAWSMAQDSDWSGRLQKAAIYAWAYSDPQAASAALANLPQRGTEKSPLRVELMAGWRVNGDVEGLTAELIAMAPGRDRENMTTALLAQVGKQGSDAVIAWADAIALDAEGGYKRVAFNRASGVVARADPEKAARWYEAHRGQEYAEKSLSVIARRSIDHHDPEVLFAWLGALPPLPGNEMDPEQTHAIAQAMKWWLRRDPEAAQAWVNSFEQVPAVYDPALASIAQFHLRKDLPFAVQWATRIQDETLRSEYVVKAARRWYRRKPDAAGEWLATAEISEEERAQITAPSALQGGRRAGRPR